VYILFIFYFIIFSSALDEVGKEIIIEKIVKIKKWFGFPIKIKAMSATKQPAVPGIKGESPTPKTVANCRLILSINDFFSFYLCNLFPNLCNLF